MLMADIFGILKSIVQRKFLRHILPESLRVFFWQNYLQKNKPDGEIIFLAADPDCKVKGVGTALLNALEEREKGKTIYLHTDDACTYQFYEHRGFERKEETDIVLEMPKGNVPLKCFIYSKTVQ